MKNVLFIVGDSWYPDPCTANGACAYELAKEFSTMGNKVYVATTNSNNNPKNMIYNNLNILQSTKRYSYIFKEKFKFSKNKVKNLIYKVINTILLPFNYYRFPICDYFYTCKMAKNIKRNIKELDIVIFVVHPVESYLVAKKIKRKFKNAVFINYQLDSLFLSADDNNLVKKKIKSIKLSNLEKKIIKFSDFTIIMEENKKEYLKKYASFKKKIKFGDIPLMTNNKISLNKGMDKFSFVYSGSFYTDIRNPKYFCELFYKFSKIYDLKLKIFCKGPKECIDIIDRYAKMSNNKIINKGYVLREEVISEISKSNIIISVGSKNCKMIPSKIFEYMSSGQKVLHIVSDEKNDAAIQYLKNYPNALIIYENDDINLNIQLIYNFALSNVKYINLKHLCNMFKENTPQYNCNLILHCKKN